MKLVHSLEESLLLIKRFSETIKNESNELKGRFLGISLGTLGASLLQSILAVMELVKEQLELVRIPNAALSFD